VVKPAIGDSQRSKGGGIDSGGARRADNAYAKSAVPSPIVVHWVLSLVRSLDPTMVPVTIPSTMSHNLEDNAATFGPARSCRTLVTKDGIIKSDAAVAGDMTAPSTPIATVGSPIPVTPFTIPARVKTAVIIDIFGAENSNTIAHSKCRGSRGRGYKATGGGLPRQFICRDGVSGRGFFTIRKVRFQLSRTTKVKGSCECRAARSRAACRASRRSLQMFFCAQR
jgi:hypothetical protein